MKNVLLQAAMKLNRSRKRRKSWQKVVQTLIMVVVFCTTYALILPAITMQAEPVCGMEDHTHTEECYTLQTVTEFTCDAGSDGIWIHQHGELCWDASENLICLLPEIREHTHTEDCFTQTQTLNCPITHVHSEACQTEQQVLSCGMEEIPAHIHDETCTGTVTVQTCTLEAHEHGEGCFEEQTYVCEIPESEEHTHSESCTGTRTVQICTAEVHTHGEGCFEEQTRVCEIPEGEGHAHSESCYTMRSVSCDQPTAEDHIHEDACYQTVKSLTCGLEELQAHTHGDTCRDAEGNLICTLPEILVHTHIEECLQAQEQKILHCTIPEHIHADACYPLEETQVTGLEFRCGFAKHIHEENCYAADGTRTCTIPEHTHEAACAVEDLDLTADVETPEQWAAAAAQLQLTGTWPDDVRTVAEAQLGYRESRKNVILVKDALKGYTRYGAKYNNPYGEWNSMFAAFVLEYAGVKDFPVNPDHDAWIAALAGAELYRTPGSYSPKAGDLVFFDEDQKENAPVEIPVDADRVAIVVEPIPTAEGARIKTIEGDVNGEVSYVTWDMGDPAILGYGQMLPGDVNTSTLTFEGEDFTVTVQFGADALLPADTILSVREIEPGTEEYEYHYNASVEMLFAGEEEAALNQDVFHARFFDITFLSGGEKIEPAAPVAVQIRYSEAVDMAKDAESHAVHFAEEGVEILDVETAEGENAQLDTFRFTQDSFSVTGIVTMAMADARAIQAASIVDFADADTSGATEYLLVAQFGRNYYALTARTDELAGYSAAVTKNGDTFSWDTEDANILWTITRNADAENSYYVQNVGTDRYLHAFKNARDDYGTTTKGTNPSTLRRVNDGRFTAQGNRYYTGLTSAGNQVTFNRVEDEDDAVRFYLAEIPRAGHHVWLDGTHDGIMAYNGSDNTHYAVESGETFTLPESWKSPNKYAYVLRGWYNIKDNTYYKPGETVTITADAVFYADWVAASYDIGQLNGDVLPSLDTSDFVTTDVFDYNPLFNVQSVSHFGSVSATGHSETWTLAQSGRVPYQDMESLNFIFRDWDSGGKHISYPGNLNTENDNQGTVTSGILGGIGSAPGRVLEALFGSGNVIGKTYIGSGNYLFQYMDETTPNYDNEHNGYYYYDSKLNAASYNQSNGRFYIYDYLERTSDSEKDGGEGEFSDFLPFNSPYVNTNGMRVKNYGDGNYQYDAKVNNQGSEAGNAGTNYHFGMRTNIHFYLPNDSGHEDDYGNFGNLSTSGDPMLFEFRGDDDLWVFLDGKLVLDVGGVHGVKEGTINFSTGEVIVEGERKATLQFTEGPHNLTVYYLERGSSQSNCAIYFNLAPRYSMEMEKRDYHTGEILADGVEFTVYTDEACTQPAPLWDTHDDAKAGLPSKSTFTVKDGSVSFFGMVAGKTYYIKETTTPTGYLQTDDIIRISLSSRGLSTNDATIMRGPNGDREDGFEIVSNSLNEETQHVHLVLTNQKANSDTMQLRVRKRWADGSVNIPDSILVYLRINGVRSEIPITLNAENGWTYTWTGLPVRDQNGRDIQYSVEESGVPGYVSEVRDVTPEDADEIFTEWLNVRSLDDGETYLLTYSGYALAATENGGFRWANLEASRNDPMARWTPNAGGSTGYVLTNQAGYSIALNGTGGFLATTDPAAVNSILYYDSSSGNLYGLNSNVAYRFGELNASGYATASTTAGIELGLLREDTYLGMILYNEILNTPIPEEEQTFLEVEKVWDTVYDTTNYNVTIRLLADGVDTGRTLVLNRRNQWKGTFEGLPLYREDGKTRIQYSVEEEQIDSYFPSYSEVTAVEGKPYEVWEVNSSLTNNGIYQFVFGNSALASNSSNSVVLATRNSQDTYQQWKVVDGRLQNVATGRYLRSERNNLTMHDRNSSDVTLADGCLKVGSRYIRVDNGSLTTTDRSGEATQLLAYRKTTLTAPDGYAVTVTNTRGVYQLPSTGGIGTGMYSIAGFALLAAAAWLLLNNQKPCGKEARKRR